MFDTTFTYSSQTALPPNCDTNQAIETLHDFETVIKLSPDCRGCKPLSPPSKKQGRTNSVKDTTKSTNGTNGVKIDGDLKLNGGINVDAVELQYWEVEDDLPFMPKKLWQGGVRYNAEFLPLEDGCDIIIHAPGGFTSTNHWRLMRDAIPEDREATLERVQSKDLAHADMTGSGWYVQIVSDAKCPKTFATIVKGFLKNSHAQLEHAFIDRLKQQQQQSTARPGLGRRRSSHF